MNHGSNVHVRNQKEKGAWQCEMHYVSSVLCVWLITVSKYLWIPSLDVLPNQIPTCQGNRVIVSKMSLTKNGHIFMQKKSMIANLRTCEYQCIVKIKNILVCAFYFGIRLRRKFEFRSIQKFEFNMFLWYDIKTTIL